MDASQIHVTYDPEADAAYIALCKVDGRVDHTVDAEHGILIDLDDSGHVLGVEILGASAALRKAAADGGRLAVREHAEDLEMLADS